MAGNRILLLVVVVCPLINGEGNATQWGTETPATESVPPLMIPPVEAKTAVNNSKMVATIKPRSSFLVKPEQYRYAFLRHVRRCPRVTFVNPVDVKKILGFWYAYATTPMAHPLFRLECSAYDASNYNFTNRILNTDYVNYAILYFCIYNNKTRKYDITIRALTRNTSPTSLTIRTIIQNMRKFRFQTKILIWLKHKAYCFEWFIRSNQDRRRFYRYLAPYNRWNDH
ncbi:uncharacterized protein LOC6602254 [Drosophila persimilis]|uniref:uncharacterized protein LOC6602254 n=1 Tax=Drosophila persimilis TaxID=7234 RepID=UPI000F09095E|nr:uncharacterized protein LOC6602254 [Drosophila persimilis]